MSAVESVSTSKYETRLAKFVTLVLMPYGGYLRYVFFRRNLRNPLASLLKSFVRKGNGSYTLKNGNSFLANGMKDLVQKIKAEEKDVQFTVNCGELGKEIRISNYRYAFQYVFEGNRYDWLDCKKRMVLDIGAGVADSCLYFVCNGALWVIGLEPDPVRYAMGLENVSLNGLTNKIEFLPMGIEATRMENSETRKIFDSQVFEGKTMTSHYESPVSKTSLEELVRTYGIGPGAILKVSCEGCEVGLFSSIDPKTLEKFDLVHVEYFHGKGQIPRLLRNAGFHVKVALPRYSVNILTGEQRILGHIKARRKFAGRAKT